MMNVLGTSSLASLLVPCMKEIGRGNAYLGIVTRRGYSTGVTMGVMINLWMGLICVLAAHSFIGTWRTLHKFSSAEHNIFGEEGQEMQSQVWKEMLGIMDKKCPAAVERMNS
ncbi:hypothetical protein BPOR_0012g00050 [Botrytis porri]|uniref:Uncharacterized protein n=1 Tax=Botrytis porri TaxID=87229 RepID=A0A4Z1L5R1_9HELO|nr:hypothetical protein BPOR_0012g00050 [Botrytis porri]